MPIEERTTLAFSYWARANEFFVCAETLLASSAPKASPLLILQGHAIELAFKSFLIFAGLSANDLKSLGHGLSRCMVKAKMFGLRSSLSESQLEALHDFSSLYASHTLRYFNQKSKTLGSTDEIQAISKILLNSVFDAITSAHPTWLQEPSGLA